jgi:hypothetical protein
LHAFISSEMFVVELMMVALSQINNTQQEEPQCNGRRMKAGRSEKESDHTVNDIHRFKVHGSQESENEGRKSSEAHCFMCGWGEKKKVTLGTSHCVKCSNVFLYCVNMKILYVHLLANALLMLSYKTFVFVMGQITY